MLPAVVFGKETGSIPITLDQKEFEKVYRKAGETALIDVAINKQKPVKALVTETDIDPVSDQILHVNLHAVSLTEKATATIPFKIIGESPIVESGKGMLLTILDEVDVEALPQDLPAEIKIDVSDLTEIDQGIVVGDLPVDREKVDIKQDPEDLVVKIEHPEMEEEEEEEVTIPIEEAVEVLTEKKEEGGDDVADTEEATEDDEAQQAIGTSA